MLKLILTKSTNFLPIPFAVMLRNLVLAMSLIHLLRLRAKLVVLRPILLHPDSGVMPNSRLVVCTKEIHTALFMVVYMKGVDGEAGSGDRFGELR
jgi:hypothetical protein